MLRPIDLRKAHYKSFHLLLATEERLGRPSNLLRVLAHSLTVLYAYLEFERALKKTDLAAKLSTLVALTISEASGDVGARS